MKTPPMLVGAAMALLIPGMKLVADPAGYSEILKEREAVLSKIVAEQESRHALGTADNEAVSAAQLALFAFRRDTAQSKNEKIQHQGSIVALHEKSLGQITARSQTGVVDPLDVLRATNALLEAKQLLEELRASEKKD